MDSLGQGSGSKNEKKNYYKCKINRTDQISEKEVGRGRGIPQEPGLRRWKNGGITLESTGGRAGLWEQMSVACFGPVGHLGGRNIQEVMENILKFK